MRLTEMQIAKELTRARREGRWADVEELQALLMEISGNAPDVPGYAPQTYTVQEGDDPFTVAENELGDPDLAPELLAANEHVAVWQPGLELELPRVQPEDDSIQLLELFETKGAPGTNWTTEDWALLERVRALTLRCRGDR